MCGFRAKWGFSRVSEPNGSLNLHSPTEGDRQRSTRERSQLYLNAKRHCRKIKKQTCGKLLSQQPRALGYLGAAMQTAGFPLSRGVSALSLHPFSRVIPYWLCELGWCTNDQPAPISNRFFKILPLNFFKIPVMKSSAQVQFSAANAGKRLHPRRPQAHTTPGGVSPPSNH